MIIPRLCGRLGNQCLQISAAIAHAKRMETTWAIPRITKDMRYWPNYFAHTVPRHNITMYSTVNVHTECPHQNYTPLPKLKDLTLDGYYQSEKYFLDAKEDIGNMLGFHCVRQEFIAIHVRRGDYVSHFSDKHPPLEIGYYAAAIAKMINLGYFKFKVYSDDIEWCRRNMNIGVPGSFSVEFSAIKDPLTDMRDMYNASGFIIANSTFSLFPALLRLDNPVTIAPAESKWYGPGNCHLSTKDLMPERFIKI